jgi:hypothetical protein
MPEPTTTTAAAVVTYTSLGLSVPMLTIAGVSMGLRMDVLFAGFSGALASIILLNSVPSSGDTWRELVRTTLRRVFFMLASSVVAGYFTPLLMLLTHVPDPLLLCAACGVGATAQKALLWWAVRGYPLQDQSPQPREGAN